MLLVQNNQYVRQKKITHDFSHSLSHLKSETASTISLFMSIILLLYIIDGGIEVVGIISSRRGDSFHCAVGHSVTFIMTTGLQENITEQKKHYRARQDIRLFENHGLTANIIPTNIKNLTRVLLLVLLGKLMETQETPSSAPAYTVKTK